MLPAFEKFSIHNQHWEGIARFADFDPHLRRLKGLPFVYESKLIDSFPYETPGVYVIGGGRQVGKSTFLKQSILSLLKKGIVPKENILFLTGEVIYTADELRRLLQSFLADKKSHSIVFIDEVNYTPDWDRAVKFAADAGLFEHCSLVLTGSDIVIIKEAMQRFPGRRGRLGQTNFHYYPLSFLEFLNLKGSVPANAIRELTDSPYEELAKSPVMEKYIGPIMQEWKNYMITGGYLTAINDLAKEGRIETGTFVTYWEWIVGDVLKHRKTENYLREILSGILKRYNTQITWNSLSKDLSIDHHKTVSDYCDLLSQMDAVFIQPCLQEHRLSAAPKKAKKIYFADPFIHHAVHIMLQETADPWTSYLKPLMTGNDEALAPYTEAAVVTLFRRKYPAYYLKNGWEIDLAYVSEKKIFPVEVKWTSQLRSKELLGIAKYPNGLIAAKVDCISRFGPNLVVPIPILIMKEVG